MIKNGNDLGQMDAAELERVSTDANNLQVKKLERIFMDACSDTNNLEVKKLDKISTDTSNHQVKKLERVSTDANNL